MPVLLLFAPCLITRFRGCFSKAQLLQETSIRQWCSLPARGSRARGVLLRALERISLHWSKSRLPCLHFNCSTVVGCKWFHHLDSFLDLGYFSDDALMGSQELTFGQTIAIVLLIKVGKNGVRSLSASFLYIFLNVVTGTMNTALGTFF